MAKGWGKIEKDLNKFKEIVAKSTSIAEVAKNFGYKKSGGVHKYLKLKFEEHNVDISHFKGQAWAKGKTKANNKSIRQVAKAIEWDWNKVFCKNSNYKGKGNQLIKKLIDAGKKEYRCEVCQISEWNKKHLRLELDHKDGNNRNNEEANLRILCPNCHSQTETHSIRKNTA